MARSDQPANTKTKPPGRPFPKGKSGNPGGRPKLPDGVRKSLPAWGAEAIQFLYDTMRNGHVSRKLRVLCAIRLADRAYGRPPQSIRVDSGPISIILQGDTDGI